MNDAIFDPQEPPVLHGTFWRPAQDHGPAWYRLYEETSVSTPDSPAVTFDAAPRTCLPERGVPGAEMCSLPTPAADDASLLLACLADIFNGRSGLLVTRMATLNRLR